MYFQPLYALILLLTPSTNGAKPCQLSWTPDLPNWFPLIWNKSEIIYPQWNGSAWSISLNPKTSLQLGCGDISNLLQSPTVPETILNCNGYGQLKIGSVTPKFSELGCLNQVKEKVAVVSTCYNGFQSVDISFTSALNNFPLITICHNPNLDETILAHHTIQGGGLNPFEISNRRPSFKEGTLFYQTITADDAYSQKSQLAVVSELVGSSLGPVYIDVGKSMYFARGHLAPDGDFVHIYEQNATYYFINVVPQWQIINNGNWKAMEMGIRNYATSKLTNLKIWTGGKGVLTLKGEKGTDVEIYLAKDFTGKRLLPVPMLSWKVIQDTNSNATVAIFMVNNPHLTQIPQNLIQCPDICSQISWVTWQTNNIQKGFTFCCDMNYVQENGILPMMPILGTNLQLLA